MRQSILLKKIHAIFIVTISLLFLQASMLSAVKEKDPKTIPLVIDFKDGLLKVFVEKQSFQKVMEEITLKTGVKVLINTSADEEISASFDYLPLEEGLQKLLSGKSHVFFYSGEAGKNARLSQILVLPESVGAMETAGPRTVRNLQPGPKKTTANNLNIDRQKIDAILNGFSNNDDEIRMKFYEALEKIQTSKGLEEAKAQAEILENSDEIRRIKESMPDLENIIMQQKTSP